MRLTDLEPDWVRDGRRRVGVSFLCPYCKEIRVACLFLNAPDARPSAQDDDSLPGNRGGKRFARSGYEFTDMSLSPGFTTDCPTGSHRFEVIDGEICSLST